MDDYFKRPVDNRKRRFKVNLSGTNNQGRRWTILITVISFLLSVTLSFFSSVIMEDTSVYAAVLVVLVIIAINILFDIIGTAVTAAEEPPFHAMASKKVYGAKEAILLIRHADKVSNFCNDVVGDICGIISGSASLLIVVTVVGNYDAADSSLAGLAITGLVASLTVGGKALGKSIAIRNSNYFIYKVGVIIRFLFGRIISKRSYGSRRKNRNKKDR